ncbi:MAG: hypothetical protein RSA21_02850 [Akkermansia sp.]
MSHKTFTRWVRGLLPALIMLFLAACLGGIVFISVWGLPKSVRQMVEDGLSGRGMVVRMDALTVDIWTGVVMEAKDVTVFSDKIGQNEELCRVDKVRLDLDWSALWDGKFVVNRVEIDNISTNFPLDEKGKHLDLSDFDAILTISPQGDVHISRAEGGLQGMFVRISGNIPSSEESSTISSEQIEQIKKYLSEAVGYLDEATWKEDKPPVWHVDLANSSNQGKSLRVTVGLNVPALRVGQLDLKDIQLNAEYQGDMIFVKKLSCRGTRETGMLNVESRINLVTRKIDLDVKSSAPLLQWGRALTGDKWVLPYQIELLSKPRLDVTGRLQANEAWSQLTDIHVMGAAALGAFKINGQKFQKFSTDFNYENGNFYMSDFRLVHENDALTGQVMGIGKEISLDLRSSLTANMIVHLVRSFGDHGFNIPEEFDLRGYPAVFVRGKFDFTKGWDVTPKIQDARIRLDLDDFSFRGLEMGPLAFLATIDGKSLVVKKCSLTHGANSLDLTGETNGKDVFFDLKTTLPPLVWEKLLPGLIPYPKELTLPSTIDLKAKGNLKLDDQKNPDLLRLNVVLTANDLAWNKVPVKTLKTEGNYDRGNLILKNFRMDDSSGYLELFAKGNLNGVLAITGRNTISILNWDKFLGLNDDDFFMARFKLCDQTKLDIFFQAMMSMSDPENEHEVKLMGTAQDIEYMGVKIISGKTSALIVPNRATLSDVELVYDNGEFLSSRKIKNGIQSSRLKSSEIVFNFTEQTVRVDGLNGVVYPDYVMRMFSTVSAKVLSEFLFTQPVSLSGNGLFPIADDFSQMKGHLTFSAPTGQVEYPLIGTILKMTSASGTIDITPDWLMVNNLKGKIWGGDFNGKIGARIDHGRDVNGVLILEKLNLAEIGKSYGETMNPATVRGSISFRSKGDMDSIVAQGNAQLQNGNLVEIPLFGTLGKAISAFIPGVGHLVNYNITQAGCDYVIENGYVKSNSFDARGTNMSLSGGGWIRMSDRQVNSDFKLGLRGLPGLFTSPIFLVAGGLFKVSGEGPLDKMSWTLSPFSGGSYAPPPGDESGAKKTPFWKFWKR